MLAKALITSESSCFANLFALFNKQNPILTFLWEKFPFKYHAAVLLSVSGVRLRHIAGDTIDEIPKRSTKNVS